MVIAVAHPPVAQDAGRRLAALVKLRDAVSARVYVPAVLVTAAGAGLIVLGWSLHWGGANFSGSVSDLHLVVIGPVSAAILGAILVVERLRPAQQRQLVARGHRHDVIYAALHATAGVLFITALTLSFQAVVRRALPWLILPKMGFVPRGLAIAAIFIAMDACNWAMHLANHRVGALWRFHELHHSQEDMNVLTVFRTHPFIHISYVVSLLPGLVLLANGTVSLTLLVIYGGFVAFAHSNTNLSFGPLGRILVSPNFHRIHHRVDGAQDVNLGFVFSVWDQLSHRAVFPTAETVGLATGLAGRPLRVEQEGRRAAHAGTFLAQMAGPFRPMPRDMQLPSVKAPATPGVAAARTALTGTPFSGPSLSSPGPQARTIG